MFKHLLYIFLFINIHTITAQVFDVESIKPGDIDKRINIVILSEGYQSSELDKFITDATSFKNALFNQSPFLEYANYFNIYAIKVPSNDSGADHPATATDIDDSGATPVFVDTYFNATYDSFGTHRLLFYEIDGNNANNTQLKINTVLANNFPAYDQALILVNSLEFGGSGGEFPVSYTGPWGNDVAIHEIGHSLFNLIDEYYPIDDALAVEGINMTQETDPNLVKWKNWIGTNDVGIYQHEDDTGTPRPWYRPHQSCKMRQINWGFCSVCKEGIIEKIHDLVSPIDSFTPTSTSIDATAFPINFQLNLINPTTNSLKSEWTLNTANFATDVDNVSVLETNLNLGLNNLTVAVTDDTSLLRVNNHETLHVYTVTWSITKSTLGIDNIIVEENKLNITVYPNPSNAIVNLKLESNNDTSLRVDIIGIDGKKVKTTFISNYETKKVDISNLSTGIYISNFYANNTLVASKKLVKN